MQEEKVAHKKEVISNFNTELDIILLLKVFKKNIIYFIAITALCVALAFIYLRYTVPIYQSKLILQVGSENTANQVLQVDNFAKKDDVAKDVELLKSKLLFKRALSKLPLQISYYNKGKILAYELYKNSPFKVLYEVKDSSSVLREKYHLEITQNNKFKLSKGENLLGEYEANSSIELGELKLRIVFDNYDDLAKEKTNTMFFVINDVDDLTNQYINQLGVFPLNPSAKTISISFIDNNALKTADVITALANEYILYDLEERSKSSKKIIEFLDNQLDKYYNKLKLSENRIQEFQVSNKIGNPTEVSSIYIDKINRFENQLIDVDFQISVLTEISKTVTGKINTIDIHNLLPTIFGTDYEASITAIINDLQNKMVKKQQMLSEVTPDNENIKIIENQIETQKQILFTTIDAQIKKLNLRRKEVLKKINEVQSKYLTIPA